MKITIVAIGKKHDSRLVEAIENYSARLTHYVKLEWKPLEAKITPTMSKEHIKNIESEVLLLQTSAEDTVIILDENGTSLSSPALARKLQHYMNQSIKNLVIIIGGAYGVSDALLKRADFIWSISPLVFPHQLVRLILAEQLYRAHSIIAGEKYHHI